MNPAADSYQSEQHELQEQLARPWTGWPPAHRDFAAGHRLAVMSTGRRDGSPQSSLTGYALSDSGEILISTKSYTAKYRNVVRQPRVSLVIVDGRESLVVYGTASIIETDPERAKLTAEIFTRVVGSVPGHVLADPYRCVLVIDPQQSVFHS